LQKRLLVLTSNIIFLVQFEIKISKIYNFIFYN